LTLTCQTLRDGFGLAANRCSPLILLLAVLRAFGADALSPWRIVSPESSLARLNGCAGYIAQVWTGTARTPNLYRGQLRERTLETAFLEYGAMQNLVRATGRTVWYLNDPVEDNPDHDWTDYRANWESTLVASLFQPEVWRYEVAPWPERVFAGRYPAGRADRQSMPPDYATEVQTVFNALNQMASESCSSLITA
jgi:hypothetical protein